MFGVPVSCGVDPAISLTRSVVFLILLSLRVLACGAGSEISRSDVAPTHALALRDPHVEDDEALGRKSSLGCGPECLRHIYARFGMQNAMQAEGLSKLGSVTTMQELAESATDAGLFVCPLRASLGELGSMHCAAIAHIDDVHFVVVEQVTQELVRGFDPDRGAFAVPRADFQQRYGGIVLVMYEGMMSAPPSLVMLRFWREAGLWICLAPGILLALAVARYVRHRQRRGIDDANGTTLGSPDSGRTNAEHA